MRLVIADAYLIILARPGNGAIKAFQGVCPRSNVPLSEAESDGREFPPPRPFSSHVAPGFPRTAGAAPV